ncbi:hypothetical protein ONZ45_g16147 [Pleurotus djamor]|nr:hypothetical protein ONZ45_g16147 [Pleurotus djamor]
MVQIPDQAMQQVEDPAPARSKTHADPERMAVIAAMSIEQKVDENILISARNTIRDRIRARSQDDGDVSDNESLISIPDIPDRDDTPPPPPRPETPPATDLWRSVLKAVSPTSLLSLLGSKRPSDLSYEERVKRLKTASVPEVSCAPGQVMVLPYCVEILELEANRSYVPLSLFTRHGQLVLADKLHQVRTVRINSSRPGERKNLFINVDSPLFEKDLLRVIRTFGTPFFIPREEINPRF